MNPRPKEPPDFDQPFEEFVRRQKCCICGKWGASVCHLKSRGSGGGDKNPPNIVPMCHPCHREQHQIGLWRFIENTGVNLYQVADDLWEKFSGSKDSP